MMTIPSEKILDQAVLDKSVVFPESMKHDLRNFIVDKMIIEWNKFAAGQVRKLDILPNCISYFCFLPNPFWSERSKF